MEENGQEELGPIVEFMIQKHAGITCVDVVVALPVFLPLLLWLERDDDDDEADDPSKYSNPSSLKRNSRSIR